MDSSYASAYRELYQEHWWWRAREALLVKVIRRHCGARKDLRILDVGCGPGLFFDRLQEFGTVAGVEPDVGLAEADPRYRELIHAGDLASLPAQDGFDLILFLDVLEHIPAAEAVLARAMQMLRRGGRIVVTVPAFMALWTSHDVINQHVRRYTRRSLRDLIVKAGGRPHRIHYFFHWTVVAKLAVRLRERIRGPGGAERLPVAFVNRVLYIVSRMEQRILTPLRPPFGTSLLAVCSRADEDGASSW
jgi:SAM-dependent methyltransferase